MTNMTGSKLRPINKDIKRVIIILKRVRKKKHILNIRKWKGIDYLNFHATNATTKVMVLS
jgi:hypothetical protein